MSPMSPSRSSDEMFLFVNPGSGGNKGKVFLEAPKPLQVDVDGGKKVDLYVYSMLEGDSGNKPGLSASQKSLRMDISIAF